MRSRARLTWAARGTVSTLLCALALAMFSGALLQSQLAQAAPHATFYGIPDNALLTSTTTPAGTATATATTTTAPAATGTPAATATAASTATPTATATPAPTATPSGPPPLILNINSAAASVGTQQYSNWCGIATVALIANYLGIHVTQGDVANSISGASSGNSTSEWGSPTQEYIPNFGNRPGVTADISYDFGTDPRSIAEALTLTTGTLYHAKVDTNGAWDATIHIVRDMLNTRQPISVFVDHGQHSVVVYGVDATGDPVTNPDSITNIYVWDPGGGISYDGIQPSQKMAIPKQTWLTGLISWSGGADYFKYPYAANVLSGVPLDPDPAIGPYTYVPALYNHLWIGHYVWVSSQGGGGVNADWEFNQYGALIAGEASSGWPATPAGYSGAVVPMPTNPPPPPPPVQVFKTKPLPKPHPKPVPKPTPTPTPLPTPRLRPSPTPVPPDAPAAPVAVESPAPPPCASLTCALRALPPGWMLLLGGALVLAALLVSGVLLLPGRARVVAAGVPATPVTPAIPPAGAPLLPPALEDVTAPASASVEAPAEAAASAAAMAEDVTPLAEPRIVPILESDGAQSQVASDTVEE